MFKIIGADQKEYGPVTADQIRQWIAESRVNGQTRVRAEGEQEWRALSTFSEFADAFGGTAQTPPMPASVGVQSDPVQAIALQAVKGPAIALIVTAGINVAWGFLQLIQLMLSRGTNALAGMPPQFADDPQIQKIMHLFYGPVGIASFGVEIVISVVMLLGAVKMRLLQNYGLALAAAILAVIPCVTPCCGTITLPFGIWALIALNKPGIKSQFH